MIDIAGRQNARFKKWLSLLESRAIKKEGLALVSGQKIIAELAADENVHIKEFLLPPKGASPDLKIPSVRLAGELFNELDVLGTKFPLAVVEIPSLGKWNGEAASGLSLIVALSDPNNLGACLRSAEAMGVQEVILTRECASPFLPRALKSASGSTFRVNLKTADALKDLDLSKSAVVCGLDMDGENLSQFQWPKDVTLVVGEEGRGLPPDLKVRRLKIPMQASVESLNAVVATSIALYTYRQQHSV
jgi:TrmH family RNA methyltransferase